MDILTFACQTLARQIRVIKDEYDEPWFVAVDICAALGLDDVATSCRKLDPEDKSKQRMPTISGDQDVTVVSEAGMYWLIVRSDKPAARPLTRWITHDVLPSISKTGQYIMPRQQKPTRWGWQPIRDVVRSRGYTGNDFTASANAIDLPGIATFTEASYRAWSYGTCLPAESLIARAEKLLNVPRAALFTEEVLANYESRGPGRRHNKVRMELRLP
jgi:prophage antirepressor-like protein